MPELSRFYGIIIAMYYDDHAPPHFHIRYGRQRAIMAVDNLAIIEGDLSPRVRGLATEWAASHREALQEVGSGAATSTAEVYPAVGVESCLWTSSKFGRSAIIAFFCVSRTVRKARSISLRSFEPLRDPAYFARVRLEEELGTIVWPNGADLCPDVLRQRLTGASLPGEASAGRAAHG
jgi:hypothetical protein